MQILTTSLFVTGQSPTIGIGYNNAGLGCFRTSPPNLIEKIERIYGQRCGHVPFEAKHVHVLVATLTTEIKMQLAYLSQLIGKSITAISPQDLLTTLHNTTHPNALVVPYINIPETEHWIRAALGATTWGLAGAMVHRLKNKAEFYQLLEDLQLEGVAVPEYTIAPVAAVPQATLRLLRTIEELINHAGVNSYPLGVMLRAAESDGQYGSCSLYEDHQHVLLIPDGAAKQARRFPTWHQALIVAQELLTARMKEQQENRVVISRLLDVADSPGLSVVVLDGQVESLGWNGQEQAPGSTACVGTYSYQRSNATLIRQQHALEALTTACFEALLRRTADMCDLDFDRQRGVANIDFMLPGPLEQQLQRQRGRPSVIYVAECNPRWTNYTDALLAVLAVKRQPATISALREVIQEGLLTIDHYPLPSQLEPERVRDELLRHDAAFRQAGISIICRMTRNPMGFIFAGNVQQAQHELACLIARLATTTKWLGVCNGKRLQSQSLVVEELKNSKMTTR